MKIFIAFSLLIFGPLGLRSQSLTLSGTMHRTELEGGCWYLLADGGKKYELTGDPAVVNPLHIDGEHITIRASPTKGIASICMMGDMVRVIARVDTVRYPLDLVVNPITLDGTVHRTKSGLWYVKMKSGKKFEFQNPPIAKYRHVGAAIREPARVLLDKKSAHENMDGVIVSGPMQIAKQKKYDAR